MSSSPLRLTVDARVRAAWQEQVAAARTTPGLLPALLQQRQALLPRFATYYTQLCALPRRVRRALQRKWKLSLASLALWLALVQSPVQANTILVGDSCTLVDAITAANTDTATGGCSAGSEADTIVLPASSTRTLTEVNNSTYGPTGLPIISSVITIEGQESRIEREGSAPEFRLLAVSSTGDLTLNETTVSGGRAPYVVGLSYNNSGGGVLNLGDLTVTNSTISGNAADFGGGGGMANFGGTLTLTDSTLSGNSAAVGGGVTNFGTLTLTNSTLSGNSAAFFGGGVTNFGTFTLTNTTISGNAAYFFGGGATNYSGGILTLTNSTLSGNSAAFFGGGVNNYGTLTLARTLVSGNTAPTAPEVSNNITLGTVLADNHNLFGVDGNAGVIGFTLGVTDIVPSVPLSAILDSIPDDNGGPTLTHALVSGSPALDAVATGCPPPATDQRGFLRPADGDTTPGVLCDIGAFEFAALPLVVLNDFVTFDPLLSTFNTTTDPTGCPPGFVGKFSFSARLTDKDTSPPLSDLRVEVDTLTNGNLLQNADGGPGGVGATLTVAEQGQFADGVLSAGEEVDVPFVICLQQRGPFTFFVDVLGVEQE